MSYIQQYESLKSQLPGSHLNWLTQFREQQLSVFEQIGFPTATDEDWRYTAIKPIANQPFEIATKLSHEVEINQLDDFDSYQMVFIDGKFSAEKSDLQAIEAGVEIVALSDLLVASPEIVEQQFNQHKRQNNNGFSVLNQALFTDGYVITIAENTQLSKPLELIFVAHSAMAASFPYNWIVAHANSQACIVERHISTDSVANLTNSRTEITLHDGAKIDFHLMQNQSYLSHHVSSLSSQQQANSQLRVYTMTLGGAIVRNNLDCALDGEAAHCDMFGMFCLTGKQHVDNHTSVVHHVPHCSSNEYYRGVLDGRAKGVFHGRIKVAVDAQKTDAQQSNSTLLLSDHAQMNSKPQLEIYADDVKCSHGATIGQIDERSLFYLRSRGMLEKQARAILIMGFVAQLIDKIELAPLKAYLNSHMLAQLGKNE